MGDRKSHLDLDFYVKVLWNILEDAYLSFPDVSRLEIERDKRTISDRVRSEGFEFLSKTLPKLGKALDQGLELGYLTCPSEFARKSKRGIRYHIPTFMSALWAAIFEPYSGACSDQHLLPNGPERPSRLILAVCCIRQVTFIAYKVETDLGELCSIKAAGSFPGIRFYIGDDPIRGRVVRARIKQLKADYRRRVRFSGASFPWI
jgi:hypothetical protein